MNGTLAQYGAGFVVVAKPDEFSGGVNEYNILGGGAGANVLRIQNPNLNGYSAWNCVDAGGVGHLAGGLGNSLSVGAFAGFSYIESATPNISGGGDCIVPPLRFIHTQSAPVPSGLRGGIKPWLDHLSNGDTNFYRDYGWSTTDGIHDSTHNCVLRIAGIGAGTSIAASSPPLVQIGSTYWTTDFGGIYADDANCELRFADQNFAIIGRTNPGDGIAYRCFNGNLAAGAGHCFYGGGLRANQTVKLQVCNDYVMHVAAATAPADANLLNGTYAAWVNESTNALTFKVKYSNGTVKTGTVALT